MNKNTLIIIVGIAFVTIVGGVVFFLTSGPGSETQPYQKESLVVEQNLAPVELTREERQALQDEGLAVPSGEDTLAKDLQRVRSSDEISAIEADLNETDLSGLDAELGTIDNDLSGL